MHSMLRFCVLLSVINYVVSGTTDPSSSLKKELDSKLQIDFAEVKSEAINSALLKKGDEVEGMYSKIGFVYWSIHAGFNGPDYTCSAPSSIYGEAVNRCFAGNGFSYKFQIVENNCDDAVVQFFEDSKCQRFLGSSILTESEGECRESTVFLDSHYLNFPAFQSVHCTTAAKPVVPQHQFQDPACEGLEELFNGRKEEAAVGPACSYSAQLGYYTDGDCSNSHSVEFNFKSTSCNGIPIELTAMCYHDTAAESTNNLPEALNDDHEYSDDAYFMHKEDVAPTPEQLQMEQALALELEQEAAVSNDDRIVGNDDDGSVYGSLFLYFTRSSTGGYIDDDDIMLPQPSLSMSEFADAEKEQLARKEGCNHHKHLRRALNNEPDPTTATSTDTASDTTYTPEGEYFLGYCTAPQPQQEDFNKELARYRYPGKRRLLVDEVPKLVFVWQSAPPPPPPLISGAALAAVLLLLLPLLTCVVLHTNKLLQRDDGKASSAITIV